MEGATICVQVLLAFPLRRALQLSAAEAVLHADPSAASDLDDDGTPPRQPAAAMRRVLQTFDVPDERQMYWWNHDSAQASGRLQAHFSFLLQATDGQW